MSDFNKIIDAIKEQYHEDVALMDMIYHLDKEYENKIKLLKDNGIGYTISDYTDKELVNLENDVLCKVCAKNIRDLIYYYNDYFYIDSCSINYDEIIDMFYIEFIANNNSKGSFEVSIYELRNPKLFEERNREYKIKNIKLRIESLKYELSRLNNHE